MTIKHETAPSVYAWARERAGYTLAEATKTLPIIEAFGKSPIERLREIESGLSNPNRTVIKGMAECYRCSEIVLNNGKIPTEPNNGVDYRSLPQTVSRIEKAVLDATVGDFRTRQSYIKAVFEDLDELTHLPFVDSVSIKEDYKKIAAAISRTINFDPQVFRKTKNPNSGFSYLRELIESCGVFVLLYDNMGTKHTSLPSNVFQGFSLADDCVPFIVINANDSAIAWISTLLHELAHIWIGKTRVCNRNYDDEIESLCDKIAQELLVSQTDIDSLKIKTDGSLDNVISSISEIAINYHVDELVLTRSLFEGRRINEDRYKRLNEAFGKTNNKTSTNHKKSNGANFYSIKKFQLGNLYFEFVKRMVDNGEIMPTKASYLTGVPATEVHNFLGLI